MAWLNRRAGFATDYEQYSVLFIAMDNEDNTTWFIIFSDVERVSCINWLNLDLTG